jgi:hypothetical protein
MTRRPKPPSPKAPSNSDQLASPSYRLAALDPDFLLGDSMRGLRFQLEYAKAEDALRRWSVHSTIVVFGSARIHPDGGPDGGEEHARWYEAARSFARIASERGGALTPNHTGRDNVIATGGGPGIMEAANRGRSRRSINRLQHHPSPRAGAQRLVDAGPHLPLPLFRDEEDALRHAGECPGRLSRRIWHA